MYKLWYYLIIDNNDYLILLFAFFITLAYNKQEGKLKMNK